MHVCIISILPLCHDAPDDVPLVLEVLQHSAEHLPLGVRLGAAVLERAAQSHRAVVRRVPRRLLVLEMLQRGRYVSGVEHVMNRYSTVLY